MPFVQSIAASKTIVVLPFKQKRGIMGTSENGKLGLHFFYVTLILGLFIVLLITFNWTGLEGFTNYLSVAATVTSLVLGILAIIYAFASSGTINRSLSSIESSAADMGQVSKELKTVLESGQSIQGRAEERTDQLHDLIGSLELGLQSLAETTKDIAGSVEAMPDRINNLQKMSSKDVEPSTDLTADKTVSESWNEERLKSYMRRASPFGVLALYAALEAHKENRYVDFFKFVGAKNYEYTWGFLIASVATGVIALEFPEERNGMRAVRLKDPSATLERCIREDWKRRMSTSRRRKVLETYGGLIESCLVDSAPPKTQP
jgi:hypothetical protein